MKIYLVYEVSDSFIKKTKGLMFQKNITPIFFKTRWGIHTIGVRDAIDIIILDEKHSVIAIKKNLSKNRVYMWNPKYSNVLELPKGTIKKYAMKIGDEIVRKSS